MQGNAREASQDIWYWILDCLRMVGSTNKEAEDKIIKRSFKRDCSTWNGMEKSKNLKCEGFKGAVTKWWCGENVPNVSSMRLLRLKRLSVLCCREVVTSATDCEWSRERRGRKRREETKTTSMTTTDEGCNHEIWWGEERNGSSDDH